MRPIIIFGVGEIAEVAHFYFTHDSEHEVAAFTVDGAYLDRSSFCGLPVVPFEEVTRHFDPSSHGFFAAIGYAQLNRLRATRAAAGKAAGYTPVSYVSSRATVWPGLVHGDNCLILEGDIIEPFVRIGSNVTLWTGSHISHHSTIADNVFIAPQVAISGDVSIGENSFIGINATIRDHVTIGARVVIGAGAVITTDCEDDGFYRPEATARSPKPSDRLQRI